jgi:Cu(I)/Ag(I) efflux system membrane fusion protein
MNQPKSPSSAIARPSRLRVLAWGAIVLTARARFLLVIGVVLLAIGYWPDLQNRWDKWTHSAQPADNVSSNTEYWCPMCPGVVAEWPGKCPVCSMALIRREKGEMTPLPDGVVARVQLSPYRIQLSGVKTIPVEYRPLEYEVAVGGLIEEPATISPGARPHFLLQADLTSRDAMLLGVGQAASVACATLPGESFSGQVLELQPLVPPRFGARVRIDVSDPRRQLQPGMYATAAVHTSVAGSETEQRLAVERWRDRTAFTAGTEGCLATLVETGVDLALRQRGMVSAVPESAVIDTGKRKVVFVEGRMAGEFDAVVVDLGRRSGDLYPLHAGVEPGQRVVAAGAVLLDAQTRLNSSAAAAYFGAGSKPSSAPPSPTPSNLSPEDRLLVERQKICPVMGGPLDDTSMGGPVPHWIRGRKVFLCCKACKAKLDESPDKYLSNLPR